ncbi:hypothetical protein O181_014183 [Austropuccinia psidii MF-1]|uniref:Uncharacterized protein n=1 Tax=Austropuccinia psidii MF-1 TaxID=1389203 RepID=A0A9Q3C031_9BASI|nr:hypothetical protein [Austropuccinia psidii MF-1]
MERSSIGVEERALHFRASYCKRTCLKTSIVNGARSAIKYTGNVGLLSCIDRNQRACIEAQDFLQPADQRIFDGKGMQFICANGCLINQSSCLQSLSHKLEHPEANVFSCFGTTPADISPLHRFL